MFREVAAAGYTLVCSVGTQQVSAVFFYGKQMRESIICRQRQTCKAVDWTLSRAIPRHFATDELKACEVPYTEVPQKQSYKFALRRCHKPQFLPHQCIGLSLCIMILYSQGS